jgi:preprotein translocase subunit SecD
MLTLSRWKVIVVIAAILFGFLFTLPNLLPQAMRDALPPFMPNKTLNLGLDLQGGSYLMLEVDTPALVKERSENLMEDVVKTLEDEGIRVANPAARQGGASVQIADPAQYDEAFRLLSRMPQPVRSGQGNDMSVNRLEGGRISVSYTARGTQELTMAAVEQSVEIIRKRVDELGTKEPSITRQGPNRIVVQVPGESDPERLKAVIGKTAKLSFQMVDQSRTYGASARSRPATSTSPSPSSSTTRCCRRRTSTSRSLAAAPRSRAASRPRAPTTSPSCCATGPCRRR